MGVLDKNFEPEDFDVSLAGKMTFYFICSSILFRNKNYIIKIFPLVFLSLISLFCLIFKNYILRKFLRFFSKSLIPFLPVLILDFTAFKGHLDFVTTFYFYLLSFLMLSPSYFLQSLLLSYFLWQYVWVVFFFFNI